MQDLTSYKKEKITVNIVWANIFGFIVLIPTLICFALPYYLIWGFDGDFIHHISSSEAPQIIFGSLRLVLVLLLGIIAHELIHGLVWAFFASKGFRSISFGVIWELLTPYCHCKEPLTVRQYIWGAMAPAVLLGVLPALVALWTGLQGWLLFGVFFTVAGSGDFLVVNSLRKENKSDLVQDHPSEAGCYIFRKIV